MKHLGDYYIFICYHPCLEIKFPLIFISVRYLDYIPLIETLASIAWPLYSGTADRTYGLSLKAATLDEATPSSVQRSEAYSSSGRPDHRMENGRSPTAYSHQRKSKVGGRKDTRQSLALKKILVSHQVEKVWP